MITIVEICKREIGKAGGKWWQYNGVEEVLVERKEGDKRENKGEKHGGEDGKEQGDGDPEYKEESTAFETMKTPFEREIEGKAKLRGVPVMNVWLSRSRIDSLRKAYGYVQIEFCFERNENSVNFS